MEGQRDKQLTMPSVSRINGFDVWLDDAEKNLRFFYQLDFVSLEANRHHLHFNENMHRKMNLFYNSIAYFYERHRTQPSKRIYEVFVSF